MKIVDKEISNFTETSVYDGQEDGEIVCALLPKDIMIVVDIGFAVIAVLLCIETRSEHC